MQIKLKAGDMVDTIHYQPHCLKRISGIVDDWIDANDGTVPLTRAA
jgi:phage tail protein X